MLAAALCEALSAALRDALPTWCTIGVVVFLTAVLAAVGGYLGSYLQTRGQRRAITDSLHEIERVTKRSKPTWRAGCGFSRSDGTFGGKCTHNCL